MDSAPDDYTLSQARWKDHREQIGLPSSGENMIGPKKGYRVSVFFFGQHFLEENASEWKHEHSHNKLLSYYNYNYYNYNYSIIVPSVLLFTIVL